MALFEPTEEEKAAASYLAWDDAALGRFTKYCGLVMRENDKDSEGLHRVASASAAMRLISQCLESNADEMTLTMQGFTSGTTPQGDWEVTVKRIRPPAEASADPAAPDIHTPVGEKAV